MTKIKEPKLPEFEQFCRWDIANPEVYATFKSLAFEAVNAGVTKSGAWTIAGALRWQTDLQTRGGDFKIPNFVIAYLVRLWIVDYPQHARLFSVRKLKTPIPAGGMEAHLANRNAL